ncbi:uncharacterized protein LOC114932898 [Nylanderia fulva]|uniref:uncharacterized protein LOC114932898 n=1 Tax=Nylanderia fulva TaxID=613905 RepID=UPI0010FAE3FE|nr:uncharacterized protein LOC114932898 [Nylanderia fulva]
MASSGEQSLDDQQRGDVSRGPPRETSPCSRHRRCRAEARIGIAASLLFAETTAADHCMVRRWLLIHRQLRHAQSQLSVISVDELTEARISWVRLIQARTFKDEIRRLRNGTPLPSRSSLHKLNPFLDCKRLLRVGGRLRNAYLQYNATHPPILPSESTYTHLVIDDHHQRTLHSGTQLTLCSLRQEYWVPRGRSLVKRHISRCSRCTRWRAAIPQLLMGNLLVPRVTPSRPFLHLARMTKDQEKKERQQEENTLNPRVTTAPDKIL